MRIGRFQVIEPLAGHGDRRVLAAYDPRLDRKVAIELGAPRDGGAEARARRRQQARAMARIGHAHVMRVHEVGEHEGELFVATDFVQGGTLQDWCDEHPPGTRERFGALLELMIQAARGLAAAHAAEVVGLPLRARDMLVDAEGRLRLRGWTMGDAADEGALAAASSEARDDQRALCRTFWEAALGSTPPEGGAVDEPGPTLRADVPAWFSAVLRRGLAGERSDRWPHVDALRTALERGRDGRRWRWAGLGVAAVVVVGLVMLRPSARDACRTPDDAPSRGWATEREALEQRFAGSGIEQVRGHALHTTRRLEQFAMQWDAERLEACNAAAEDQPLAEARLACLERAASGFHVVLREIDQLEPQRMGTASTLTLALPELGECREPDPGRFEGIHDASVREASRTLAEASTLVNLRRVTKAEELVAPLEAEGWAGSPGVESRGRLVLANAAYARGEFERARALGFASLRAAELGDDAGDAAAAWAVVGNAELAMSRLDEAAFAAERVESLATSVDDVMLLADAKALMGGLESERGHTEVAVASYRLAERYMRAELGDRHTRLASLYQDMTKPLAQSGRPDQAIAMARASVQMLEDLVGAESPLSIRARGNLGMVLSDLGEREAALVELERAEVGFAADPAPPANDRFRCGLRRAEMLGLLGRTDEAVAALDRLQLPPGDREAPIVLLVVRGTVLLESGRGAESVAAYHEVLAALEGDGSHTARMHRSTARANLSLALTLVGRTEEAMALVEPTIAEYEALGMPPERVGNLLIEFVAVYRAAGRLEDAHQAAERGVAMLERGKAPTEVLVRARAELAAAEAALREQEGVP